MQHDREDRCGLGTAAIDPAVESGWAEADDRGRRLAHEFGDELRADGVTVESPGRLITMMQSATAAIEARDDGRAYANGLAIGIIELITGLSLS